MKTEKQNLRFCKNESPDDYTEEIRDVLRTAMKIQALFTKKQMRIVETSNLVN